LTGEEVEDHVHDLWGKGNPKTGNGRYISHESLGKMLGLTGSWTTSLISAKESRERLGFKLKLPASQKVSTFDLDVTKGIENDADRKTLIEKKVDGSIQGREIREYAQTVKNSPVAVKDAVLDKPKIFTPKVAAELSKLPEESQKGTIAAIKKGKMGEDDAIELSKSVMSSPKAVQDAIFDKPKQFTSKVAAEISSLPTEEAQKSTIDAIKKHRLEEEESIQLARMMEGQIAFTKEHEEEFTAKASQFAGVLKQWERERDTSDTTPGKVRIGRATQNVMTHMRLVSAIQGSSGTCTCPHCGKAAAEYIRWTCCNEGKNETLAQAFEDAKKQQANIVREETGRKVKWE